MFELGDDTLIQLRNRGLPIFWLTKANSFVYSKILKQHCEHC